MQLLGELHRGKETWACSYYKIPVGPSLPLHGSEYVQLRTFVYILTFTYLFRLPNSHFLPLIHTQRLFFLPSLHILLISILYLQTAWPLKI